MLTDFDAFWLYSKFKHKEITSKWDTINFVVIYVKKFKAKRSFIYIGMCL